MANESQVQLVAVQTVVRRETTDAEEQRFAPGKTFSVSKKEAARLIRIGAAKSPDDDADEDEDEGEAEPRKRPETRAELEARAEELGIDLGELKGTGSKGALKNSDIEAAIAAFEEETDTGEVLKNPSLA